MIPLLEAATRNRRARPVQLDGRSRQGKAKVLVTKSCSEMLIFYSDKKKAYCGFNVR
jgi:hypothetical protein